MRTPTVDNTTTKLWDSEQVEIRRYTNGSGMMIGIQIDGYRSEIPLTPGDAYDLMKALEFGLQEWGRL